MRDLCFFFFPFFKGSYSALSFFFSHWLKTALPAACLRGGDFLKRLPENKKPWQNPPPLPPPALSLKEPEIRSVFGEANLSSPPQRWL